MPEDKPDEGGVTIEVPNDDGGGGGSSDSSSSSSSSSGSSAPAVDPRKPYRTLLLRLRLPVGLFADLVSRAVAEKWDADEFLWALSSTKQLNRLLPGIEQLIIDQDLTVPEAIHLWRGMSYAYESELRDKGLWGIAKGKLSKEAVGLAINKGIDVDEMVFRFQIYEQAKRTDGVRAAFNAILKARGEQQLDKQGWLNFLLGKSDAALNDLWESAQLLQELGPMGLKIKEARKLGRALGQPGTAVDVSDALAVVERLRSQVGSQRLSDAGISTADLALAAMSEGLVRADLKSKAAGILAQLEDLERDQANASSAVDRTASFTRGGRPISESAPQGEYAG